jgi:hypothetical protein
VARPNCPIEVCGKETEFGNEAGGNEADVLFCPESFRGWKTKPMSKSEEEASRIKPFKLTLTL